VLCCSAARSGRDQPVGIVSLRRKNRAACYQPKLPQPQAVAEHIWQRNLPAWQSSIKIMVRRQGSVPTLRTERRSVVRRTMIVHCVELGSHWWKRISKDSNGDYEPRNSAFFNSTALPKGTSETHWLRCWTIPGIVRFNIAGFPRATAPPHLLGANAYSDGIENLNGTNRILFQCAVRFDQAIDSYLVVVRSAMCGRIEFGSDWKTPGVRVVCASANKGGQETLMLMPPNGAIKTEDGIWQIAWRKDGLSHRRALLVLDSEISLTSSDFKAEGVHDERTV
jgi:hypothetical protein